MKLKLIVPVLFLTVGCQNVRHTLFPGSGSKPGTDPTKVCRASPGTWQKTVDSDSITLTTGVVNGEDGADLHLAICKADTRCPSGTPIANQNAYGLCGDMSTCETFANTGVSSDGVMVEFVPNQVTIQLAQSKAYVVYSLRVNLSCH